MLWAKVNGVRFNQFLILVCQAIGVIGDCKHNIYLYFSPASTGLGRVVHPLTRPKQFINSKNQEQQTAGELRMSDWTRCKPPLSVQILDGVGQEEYRPSLAPWRSARGKLKTLLNLTRISE